MHVVGSSISLTIKRTLHKKVLCRHAVHLAQESKGLSRTAKYTLPMLLT